LPDHATYLPFLAAVFAMQAVPGPDTVLVAVRGMGQGRGMAFHTVLGMTLLAGLIQLPLLALGLGALAHASPVLFDLIRVAGAAYLVWLGLRFLLRTGTRLSRAIAPAAPSPRHAMLQGMIINLTNPNPLIFMLAFLPQFVSPAQGSAAAQLLVLGATQKLTGFGVLGLVALGSGRLGDWLAEKPGFALWQSRLTGAIMIALGAWLLVGR
jgi:threonine/homoserine/homoserine lactone efflux protein